MGRLLAATALVVASSGCSQLFGLEPPARIDASTGIDAVIPDSVTDGVQPACRGTLLSVCPSGPLAGSLTLSGAMNTDADTRCVITMGACVIEADRIDVMSTLHASGTRPLVLFATSDITISGTLDVGAFRAGGADVLGAGEATGAACGGTPGGSSSSNQGAGGGAGGSFSGAGGKGAPGGAGALGGSAAAPLAIVTVLRGGCPGTAGGNVGASLGGAGGHGGGAVYLIAGHQIVIGGSITASGMGGAGGQISAGGGGGGSGGLIALEAPVISSSGIVVANGGGGGEGGGLNNVGMDGGSSVSGTMAAVGGSGNANGGDGGPGSVGVTRVGGDGMIGSVGGGGGGGGAGFLMGYGAQAIGGTVSPPAS